MKTTTKTRSELIAASNRSIARAYAAQRAAILETIRREYSRPRYRDLNQVYVPTAAEIDRYMMSLSTATINQLKDAAGFWTEND